MRDADVIVVGGGPAGLATAIALASRGLAVTVLERQRDAPDKACGEGLLPPALRALDELGVRALLDPAGTAPIDGIRYVEPDGRSAQGRLAAPGGLVVRRTALTAALESRARALGVELHHGARVTATQRGADRVLVDTPDGTLGARLLIAADGLHSPIRRAAGLERPRRGPRRFGLRQHLRARCRDRFVEVHFAGGVEAYVAPAGDHCTGLTFLWDEGAIAAATIPALLARFPPLAARLGGAAAVSQPRGAGPMACAARAQIADRLALVGDAAGYIDAITGEGLSVALHCALSLGRVVPDALSGAPLEPYQRDFDRLFRRYALVTRGVLALAHRPRVRRPVLRTLATFPALFDHMLAWTVG